MEKLDGQKAAKLTSNRDNCGHPRFVDQLRIFRLAGVETEQQNLVVTGQAMDDLAAAEGTTPQGRHPTGQDAWCATQAPAPSAAADAIRATAAARGLPLSRTA
jgi:hypothetical protein